MNETRSMTKESSVDKLVGGITLQHLKLMSDSKEKNKLEIFENWSILKEKNKIVIKFSIAIMKLNFLVFIEFSRCKYLYMKYD
jgi:hypothetical protein